MLRTCAYVVVFALAPVGALAQHTLYAAETISGSLGGNTSQYGGLQRYDFASSGAAPTTGSGVPASSLSDPVGLHREGGNLYVINRHGNTTGQGSVQQFLWDGSSLSGGSTIATASSSSYQGFHGADFAPNGDLYVATLSAGVRRYRDSGSGLVDIGGVSSGSVRDVWVSPDGGKLIQSATNGTLVVTDIQENGFGSTTAFTVAGAGAMHQMQFFGGSLYVTSFTSSTVHKVDLDGSFAPTSSSVLLNYSGAIGLAFSPDGQDLYVSSHTGNTIGRYQDQSGSWVFLGDISTGHNMGYLETVPEPGTLAALALGALGVARRRRKNSHSSD